MSQAINGMAVTWSDGSLQTGIKLNVTDTSSNAASNLLDLQVGGASRFSVGKSGPTIVSATGLADSAALLSVVHSGSTKFGVSVRDGAVFDMGASRGLTFRRDGANSGGLGLNGTSFRLQNNASGYISWNPNETLSGADDLFLFRDAANTLAQRNGTNAQAFRIYNRLDGIDNYERAKIQWDTNVLKIGTEKGTLGGTARALEFQTDGTTRLTIGTDASATFTGSITSVAVSVGATAFVGFTGRGRFRSSTDGVIELLNAGSNDFGRLNFGGTTSAFPALKRDAAKIQVVDAAGNFTGTSGLVTQNLNFQGVTVANLPAAPVAGDVAYVTDGGAALAWGDTVTGSGSTKYLVWYNGTNWTVAGK